MATLKQRIEALEYICKPARPRGRRIESFTAGSGEKWIRQIEGELVIEMQDDDRGELPSQRIIQAILNNEEKPADLSPSASTFWDTAARINEEI